MVEIPFKNGFDISCQELVFSMLNLLDKILMRCIDMRSRCVEGLFELEEKIDVRLSFTTLCCYPQ
jgi:hypothetical protein